MPSSSMPPVTALRCRVISVDQYGGPNMASALSDSNCPRVIRGENSHATMMAMFSHLMNDHGIDEDEAAHFELRWREQAEQRIGARLTLTRVLAAQGIEATEDQVKAMVRDLEKAGTPIQITHRARLGSPASA